MSACYVTVGTSTDREDRRLPLGALKHEGGLLALRPALRGPRRPLLLSRDPEA